MRQIDGGVKHTLESSSLVFASLWDIERTDGTVLRFTNHSSKLTYDGETYDPVGGFDASARRHQAQFQSRNMNVMGVISDPSITDDDLRAGKYRGTVITERVVDPRKPWQGVYLTNVWHIKSVRWNGESWEAEVGGPEVRLAIMEGDVHARNCRHDLGNDICRIDLSVMRLSGKAVTAVNSQRLEVQTDISTILDVTGSSQANQDNWFRYGKLTWTSGANEDLEFDIRSSSVTNGVIALRLQTPFDIQVGDTFNIEPGCDKTISTCSTKFDNVINHGGFPTIPGTDAMRRGPNAKDT